MFSAIAAFFVIGAFGFWSVMIALAALIVWEIDNEGFAVSTFATLVITAIVLWANDISLWGLITTNPVVVLSMVGGYFLAGTAWAVGKWYFYIRRYNHAYDEVKTKYLRIYSQQLVEHFTESEFETFRTAVIERFNELSGKPSWRDPSSFEFPLASERKAAILGWMMYWPLSATWTLINDPVKRAFIAIYRNISGSLDRMTKSLTGNIQREVNLGKSKD